jgi:peptidoglycan hydrolase-like protein with peptidoglycan-binding domain
MAICCFYPGKASRMAQSVPEVGATLRGSVGSGGANGAQDVRLVQTLLNAVKPLVPQVGAPLTVDGLVGPKTTGAIRNFQNAQFGVADGRIDPGQRTLARLNVLLAPFLPATTGTSGFALAGAPSAPPASPPMTPIQAAVEATPRAVAWVTAARMHLELLRVAAFAGGTAALGTPAFAIANVHFHLDRDPLSVQGNLMHISSVFLVMLAVFANPGKYYAEGPATPTSPFADASVGGFNFAGVRITFRTRFPGCGPNTRAAMLVHEGAHFCGAANEIDHFATEWPAPDGAPQGKSTRNYAQLTTSEAMRNAASYAAFAIHAAFGVDHRFGAADITQ